MKRYGYYVVNLSLEEAWNRTLIFFENRNSKIKDQYISKNNIYRKLKIRHGASFRIYGSSMGETYEIIFGFNPSDNATYVSISVNYSYFGKGIPSQIPKEILKKLAYELDITPMKLVKEIDHDFLANLDKIHEIPSHQIANLSNIFCVACGEVNSIKATYCASCGTQIDK